MRHVLTATILTILALPAAAREEEAARFAVSLRGVTGLQLAWNAVTDAGGYAVSGAVATSGAVGLFTDFSYDGTAQGRIDGDRAVPLRYVETSETPDGPERLVMEYKSGVPRIAERVPAEALKPYTLDPASQGGRVDPLTGVWLLTRDVDAGRACDLDFRVYGGNRASRIVLGNPTPVEGGVACAGTLIPEGGFPPEEGRGEPTAFSLVYDDAPGGRLRARELRFGTRFGDAVLRRR